MLAPRCLCQSNNGVCFFSVVMMVLPGAGGASNRRDGQRRHASSMSNSIADLAEAGALCLSRSRNAPPVNPRDRSTVEVVAVAAKKERDRKLEEKKRKKEEIKAKKLERKKKRRERGTTAVDVNEPIADESDDAQSRDERQ